MRRPFTLALILCLALTGIGLGAARGTIMLGGQIVLCTGQGVVVLDRPGPHSGADPAAPGPAHLCPDMALSLLAATAVPAPDFGRAEGAARRDRHPVPATAPGRESPRPSARGPPVLHRSAPTLA